MTLLVSRTNQLELKPVNYFNTFKIPLFFENFISIYKWI